MGFPGYRRSLRASLAYVGIAAATASALVVLQSGVAFAADVITVSPGSDTAISVMEGNSTGSKEVATFTDSGNGPILTAQRIAECDSARYTATIDWSGDGKDTSSGTVACTDTAGTWAVWGAHVYNDSGTFHINVTVTDTTDEVSGTGKNTATATVSDADLFWDSDNSPQSGVFTSVEGKSLTVVVDFGDDRAFPREGLTRDASITGTINWGDGTAPQTVQATAPSGCECNSHDSEIRASHVYDAAIPSTALYHITVTAKDDGGSTATADFGAMISDGALTAGSNLSLGATATQAFNSVVGTFTDEAGAQAAASEFVATINWGDNTTSTGTVTKTGTGAFGVSGTHAYATTGSKSITATVTDEEGSTVTLRATATVTAAPAVAPVVLPATGHPSPPTTPLIPMALLILGLVSLVAGGRILAKMPR